MARWFYIPLFTALIYCVFFQLNNFLFGWLEFSSGVNWVFLPSGLRLLLVLLWGPWASIGISIGSAWLSFAYYPFNNEIDFLVTGLISGASPLLARFIAEHLFKWDVGLSSKSPLVLIKLALMFALISSTLHQIWFSWMGRSEDFLKGIFVMFTGDIFGTLLLLYAFKFILFLADTIQDKKPLI